MPIFAHDDIDFHYRDEGSGIPFVFQHGLSSNITQPFELFPPREGIRLLAFDCRGHGETRPLGERAKLGIPSSAEDLLAFLDYRNIEAAVIGGTSMGAAISLNFALRYPNRVLGLVLSRPAWLDRVNPENLQLLGIVAKFLREYGRDRGQRMFQETEEYRELLRQSPVWAESVCSPFQTSRVEEMAAVLECVPTTRPCAGLSELQSIRVPTLVLANDQDPFHPAEFAKTLSAHISQSELREVTPRAVNASQHRADVDRHISEFLQRHFAAC